MNSINMSDSSIYSNPTQSPKFKINFEPRFNKSTILLENPNFDDIHHQIRNILDIKIEITPTHISFKKSLGQVKTSLWAFNKATPNFEKWEWVLDSNDISTIENIREHDVSFYIHVSAIIMLRDNSIIPIYGKDLLRFSESDWLSFIKNFGYSTKYTNSIPSVLLDDKSWHNAYKKLDTARDNLRSGKTYDALRQCLNAIEFYKDSNTHGGPYSDKVWEELLQDIIPQKKNGIKGLLSGVSTYLNKVGHHRNTTRSENGDLENISLDQYEAEILLSITQLVVTYLERLRTNE